MDNPVLKLAVWATLVDGIGSLLIGLTAVKALVGYLRSGGLPAAVNRQRLELSTGLVSALSFKTGAGLIRSLTIASLPQFYLFLAIVALRFFLGQVLKKESSKYR